MTKKRFAITSIALLVVVIFSCCKKNDRDISSNQTIENILDDTTKVLVASLPIYLDSTNVLISPLGWKTNHSGKDNSVYSYAKSKGEYSDSHIFSSKDNISGEMFNIIFEDIKTGEQRLLTDKILNITSVTYLRDFWRMHNKQYLLYNVYDIDYNNDGKLDNKDKIAAKYLSYSDGSNFIKLTPDNHIIEDSDLILANGKYYFKTAEDINQEDKPNKKDIYHYYYIDLTLDSLKVEEYFPLKLLREN